MRMQCECPEMVPSEGLFPSLFHLTQACEGEIAFLKSQHQEVGNTLLEREKEFQTLMLKNKELKKTVTILVRAEDCWIDSEAEILFYMHFDLPITHFSGEAQL